MDKLAQNPDLTPRDARLIERQRGVFVAEMRFQEGKRHFVGGDIPSAIRSWKESNASLRSWPLALAILLVSLAPRLAAKAFALRLHLLLGGIHPR
jgi:hypothetical protein